MSLAQIPESAKKMLADRPSRALMRDLILFQFYIESGFTDYSFENAMKRIFDELERRNPVGYHKWLDSDKSIFDLVND